MVDERWSVVMKREREMREKREVGVGEGERREKGNDKSKGGTNLL